MSILILYQIKQIRKKQISCGKNTGSEAAVARSPVQMNPAYGMTGRGCAWPGGNMAA